MFLLAAVPLLLLVSMAVPAAAWGPGEPMQQPFDPGIEAVRYNDDGREEDFLNVKNALWHMYKKRGGGWSDWESLGGSLIGSPAAAIDSSGRLHVFVVGTDRQLYVKWQVGPNAGWTTDWTSMGGRLTSNPAALASLGGLIEVFARGADNAMWTRWQVPAGAGLTWSSWATIGGGFVDYPRLPSDNTPELQPDYVTVKATGFNGAFWCDTRQPVTAGRWGGWHPC
ncbi:MAG: hypothetical protein AUI14_07855 [Actinobacteria bacterium 13_2_20CM_2_71_6]|nr:MAG: hypothetical protein AUI14_07855 [Actinobacteria bacterium 13_2_20CM_2_71_6]